MITTLGGLIEPYGIYYHRRIKNGYYKDNEKRKETSLALP
jgi:hypothetical protein